MEIEIMSTPEVEGIPKNILSGMVGLSIKTNYKPGEECVVDIATLLSLMEQHCIDAYNHMIKFFGRDRGIVFYFSPDMYRVIT